MSSGIRILIVEDDSTLGKAMLEALTRAGHTAVHCETVVRALTTAEHNEFDCLIVDCMLPKMNGVDLVEEIQQFLPQRAKVFLYSGIFKDRGFMKEAMEKTKAEAFFPKPFDLKVLLEYIQKSFPPAARSQEPPLLSLYTSMAFSRETFNALANHEPTIHALHLPMLYNRLQEIGVTGELTLTNSSGDLFTLSYHEGRVFSVKTPDKESYFGSVAINFGFVEPDEVMKALKKADSRPLGQRLVDSMSLSPHAIQVILEEQLALRLSQTIQSDDVALNWKDIDYPAPQLSLRENRFEQLQEDWLKSKITADWIRSNLSTWGNYTIEGRFHRTISDPMTIEMVLNHPDFNDKKDLQFMFNALLKAQAFIGARTDTSKDFSSLEFRLNRLLEDYHQRNYFQVLNVGEKASVGQIHRAYSTLQETYDPALLAPGCPPHIKEKCTEFFRLIQNAFTVLSDNSTRTQYGLHLNNQRNQQKLNAEPIFHAAILELHYGSYEDAGRKFQLLIDQKVEFKDLKSYRLWAGLKANRSFNEIKPDQIPPEERHSAIYHTAKGIYHINKRQFNKALEALQKAHVLDPNLKPARTELKRLLRDVQKLGSRDMVKDVTSIVENIFGKIRRGA